MKPSLSPEIISQISAYFVNIKSVDAVYLLGSAARGSMKPGSDVDLALLPNYEESKITSLDLFQVTGELGYQFGLDFDLGLLHSENLVYAKEAIFTGKAIFFRDAMALKRRVNTLLSMYFNFQVERQVVLNAYRA